MPKQYEAIRDALIAKGKSAEEAKTSAARIYNARRKPGERPVTGRSETLGDAATRHVRPRLGIVEDKRMRGAPRYSGGTTGKGKFD